MNTIRDGIPANSIVGKVVVQPAPPGVSKLPLVIKFGYKPVSAFNQRFKPWSTPPGLGCVNPKVNTSPSFKSTPVKVTPLPEATPPVITVALAKFPSPSVSTNNSKSYVDGLILIPLNVMVRLLTEPFSATFHSRPIRFKALAAVGSSVVCIAILALSFPQSK